MSTSPLPNLQPSPRKRIFPRPIVLLVDDNSQNLEVLEAFLADLATNVVVASDGGSEKVTSTFVAKRSAILNVSSGSD
jgi:CheY-like chemotaxis protein